MITLSIQEKVNSTAKIVTLESMLNLLNRSKEMQIKTIGRALVALSGRQVEDEFERNYVKFRNGIGFQPSDARSGCLTAKYFKKHGTLLDWQIDKWMKLTSSGKPRICKYIRQLNEIAVAKEQQKSPMLKGIIA